MTSLVKHLKTYYLLQLCNSEDFVKLEGLNFIVVIIVTLLMFRLLGLSRT